MGKESFRLLLLLLLSMQLSGSLSPPQPPFCPGNLSQTWQTDVTSLCQECVCVCVASVNCSSAVRVQKYFAADGCLLKPPVSSCQDADLSDAFLRICQSGSFFLFSEKKQCRISEVHSLKELR